MEEQITNAIIALEEQSLVDVVQSINCTGKTTLIRFSMGGEWFDLMLVA